MRRQPLPGKKSVLLGRDWPGPKPNLTSRPEQLAEPFQGRLGSRPLILIEQICFSGAVCHERIGSPIDSFRPADQHERSVWLSSPATRSAGRSRMLWKDLKSKAEEYRTATAKRNCSSITFCSKAQAVSEPSSSAG